MENSFRQAASIKLFKKYSLFFVVTSCSILLFVSIGLYMNYKEKQYYTTYSDQMMRINHLMQQSTDRAQKIIQSYLQKDPVTEHVKIGEGIVAGSSHSIGEFNRTIDKMVLDSEACNKMLIELHDPPEALIKPYLQLLDAHIIYKEYLNLAIHPSGDLKILASREKALKKEFEERMKTFETLVNPT